MKRLLIPEDIVIGTRVVDTSGDTGEIKNVISIHNVYIEYDNGGSGLYCLDDTCKDRKPDEILYRIFD